jgi:hypothetical protein
MSVKNSPAKKRRSITLRAKSQQRCRRRRGLFKKAHEYSIEYDPDVYVMLWLQKSGQIFTFNSDSTEEWSPSLRELVCVLIAYNILGFLQQQDFYYPKPVKITSKNFANKYVNPVASANREESSSTNTNSEVSDSVTK